MSCGGGGLVGVEMVAVAGEMEVYGMVYDILEYLYMAINMNELG